MGYYGKNLTSSDSYEEFEIELLSFLGHKYDSEYNVDDYKDHTEIISKEIFENKVDDIFQWMINNNKTFEDGLFLAYHILIRGVDISDEYIDKLIYFFKNDEWSKRDLERKLYINLAIESLEKYKVDKTPVDIDYYFYFENYYISKGKDNNIISETNIKNLFEKYFNINVIEILRGVYSLLFLISEEDFLKLYNENGTNIICGITLLTKIKN